MGMHDSTKTRVAPVFTELFHLDPTGGSWLATLLSLPARDGAALDRPAAAPVLPSTVGFGTAEVSLAPPLGLLRWMVMHPERLTTPTHAAALAAPTQAKRAALLAGELGVQTDALALLAHGAPALGWYVFEGRSRPDVYFETPDAIVVIEGKRTEPTATTATSWLRGRHQMLRHLDCAWERRGGKALFGFFIVEATEAEGRVPTTWRAACATTVALETLEQSLPHRSAAEQKAIAGAFLGATTWQLVCQQLELTMPG